jgi:hypothetical protein
MGRSNVSLNSRGGSAMLLLKRLSEKGILILKKECRLKAVDYAMILTAIIFMVYMSAIFRTAASTIGVAAQ